MEDVSDFLARNLMERNIMKKIILDLDTGIDDTLALSYILGSEDAVLPVPMAMCCWKRVSVMI